MRARRSVLIGAALSLIAGVALSGLRSPATANQGAPPSLARHPGGTPAFSHVFVIVGENTSLGRLTRAHAPYLVGRLKPRAAWLDGYRALSNSSSLGDYIEMTSGQSIACERDNSLPVDLETDKSVCHQRVDNIFSQLDAIHTGWTEWNESMPHPCAFYDDGTAWAGDVYSVHHNPAVYYDRIEGNRYVEDFDMAPKLECRRRVLPLGTTAFNDSSAFDAAATGGHLAPLNYIVPNDCENGHDPCGTDDPIRQFDHFLAREVPKIEASPAFDAHSLIVITWDEQGDNAPHDPRVGCLWLGPLVRPGMYTGTWTHASLLRALEDGYRVPHLADSRTAHSVDRIWK